MSFSSLFALHGFACSPAQFQRLATEVHAPWLGGHGPTPDLSAATFEGEVARLLALARALPAPRRLVGYSQGARLALGLLAASPDTFSEAVLFGANPGLESESERSGRRRWEDGWARLLETQGVEAFVSEWEMLPIFDSQQSLSSRLLEQQRRERLAHTPEGLAFAMRALGLGAMPDLRPSLRSVRVPVRLVAGRLDEKFIALHEELVQLMPFASAETLADVGHNPLLEAPGAVRHLLLP